MEKQVEYFLRHFASCLQLARMYGCQHPGFEKSLKALYQELRSIFSQQKDLTIAIIDNELVSGDDIFFNVSKRLGGLINDLTKRGIEKVTFKKEVEKEELKTFFLFFLLPEEKKIDPGVYLASKTMGNIKVARIGKPTFREKRENLPENFSRLIYPKFLNRLSESLLKFIQGQPLEIAHFSDLIDNFIKGIHSNYQEVLKLSQLRKKDSISFAHILNVAFLAVSFSRALGFDDLLSKKIGLAALFHDIGKIYISDRSLKGKKLSREEFKEIKNHSFLGAKLLLKHIEQVGELALVVSLEHHLRFDLKGYPKLKYFRRPHLGSMLVTICDVYDAFSQRRSYKNSYLPEYIYKIMKAGRGSHFHPDLFDAFFKFMGVWPNGTVVSLNNGGIAMVESQNSDDIFSPNLKMTSPPSSQIIDLRKEPSLKIKSSFDSRANPPAF